MTTYLELAFPALSLLGIFAFLAFADAYLLRVALNKRGSQVSLKKTLGVSTGAVALSFASGGALAYWWIFGQGGAVVLPWLMLLPMLFVTPGAIAGMNVLFTVAIALLYPKS